MDVRRMQRRKTLLFVVAVSILALTTVSAAEIPRQDGPPRNPVVTAPFTLTSPDFHRLLSREWTRLPVRKLADGTTLVDLDRSYAHVTLAHSPDGVHVVITCVGSETAARRLLDQSKPLPQQREP